MKGKSHLFFLDLYETKVAIISWFEIKMKEVCKEKVIYFS